MKHTPKEYAAAGATLASSLIAFFTIAAELLGHTLAPIVPPGAPLPVPTLNGIPNTLVYDQWFGRTAPATMTMGTGGSTAVLQGPTNQDITFKQQGTSKRVMNFALGDGAGGNANRITFNSDGISFAAGTTQLIAAGTLNLKPGAAAAATLYDGNNAPAATGCLGGGLAVGNGGVCLGKAQWTMTLPNLAAITNATRDFAVSVTASSANGGGTQTPKDCRYTVDTVGAVGGTCTYSLRDTTTSTNICTVSQSCTTAAGTTTNCATSGSIAAGDTVSLRVVAPVGDTSAIGTMVCSGYY